MVTEENGRREPEYREALYEEKCFADLFHKSEEDALLWAQETLYAKATRVHHDSGAVRRTGRNGEKRYLCYREPGTGARLGVVVKTEGAGFLDRMSKFMTIVGSEKVKK